MRFLQMATVLINAKEEEVTSNAIHPITELLTILLGWEVGLVYLSNEASFTTILVKSLLQLDDDAASTGCLIAHCMEVCNSCQQSPLIIFTLSCPRIRLFPVILGDAMCRYLVDIFQQWCIHGE